VKLNRTDRDVVVVGAVSFAALAMLFSFAALVTAAHSSRQSKSADQRAAKLSGSALIGSAAKVTLQEFSITVKPGLVQSGKVTLEVENVGTITHELVIVRAPSVAALPIVKVAGERSVGAIDEEAIAEADKMGESGDVAAGKTVKKTFALPPGTYVVFCNIDSKSGGATVNHFTHGMSATLLVV
jgi:hypothetical protein